MQIVIVTCVRINVKLWMMYLLRQKTNPVPYHENINFMGNIIQKIPWHVDALVTAAQDI